MTAVLAATIHDPEGKLAAAIATHAGTLRGTFADFALNVSDATPDSVLTAARDHLGAHTMVHAQGEARIGRNRREAVKLALQGAASTILYSDFDHVMRWIEADPEELRAILTIRSDCDFLVVGRSVRAFAVAPERLRETERLVNHVYRLMTGHDWDLMFAVRRFSRKGAGTVVARSREDSIANDVEWPLLAEAAGLAIGYVAADELHYRTMEEFGAPADTLDGDPLQWIRRIEIAASHAAAMRPFLKR
ncbi:MAG: hypothetical protein JSR60_09255 [Proteobacteria bacterium]|nr:hypothetical protein [Pseudomonadota bacterium]